MSAAVIQGGEPLNTSLLCNEGSVCICAVCSLRFMDNMVADLISLPLMWYWVGGGFTALLGTLWCLGSVFLLMDPRNDEHRGRAWLKTWAMPLHALSPVMYTLLARWTGWYGQVPVLAFSLWRFWGLLTTPLPKKDLPPGALPLRTVHEWVPDRVLIMT